MIAWRRGTGRTEHRPLKTSWLLPGPEDPGVRAGVRLACPGLGFSPFGTTESFQRAGSNPLEPALLFDLLPFQMSGRLYSLA